jgi:hypothetical protein
LFLIYLLSLLRILLILVTRGRAAAGHAWRDGIKTVTSRPHGRDLRNADEFDDREFMVNSYLSSPTAIASPPRPGASGPRG